MTLTSWIIDIALILIVFRQMIEERLTARTILIPAALLTWAGYTYLRGFPTAGNDLLLIAAFTGVGVLFGVAGGFLTRVRYHDGAVRIKATIPAAALWVVSMTARAAFAIWTSYSSGIAHIGSFSVAHDITTSQAWVTAILMMAFGEVIFRLGIIVIRGQILSSHAAGSAANAAFASPVESGYRS